MATKNPTNADILAELKDMNYRIINLETWKIAEDAARKAIRDYKTSEYNAHKDTETKEWVKVAKQVGIVLGIVIAILYAYAATKGLHI